MFGDHILVGGLEAIFFYIHLMVCLFTLAAQIATHGTCLLFAQFGFVQRCACGSVCAISAAMLTSVDMLTFGHCYPVVVFLSPLLSAFVALNSPLTRPAECMAHSRGTTGTFFYYIS